MKLRILFNRVSPPLRQWERQLLDAVGRALPSTLTTAFAEQVAEINYVQRHQGGREINFYRMQGKRANVSTAPKIRTPSEEYLFASVLLEPPGRKAVTCQLWVVHGIVFSITCDASTQKVDASAKVRVLDVHPPTAEIEPHNPLLDSINAEVRSEYEKRVSTGRMFAEGVQLLEPRKLRHVAAEDLDYCVLGESVENELLVARSDKAQREIFFLNVESGEVRRAAGSLAELMNG